MAGVGGFASRAVTLMGRVATWRALRLSNHSINDKPVHHLTRPVSRDLAMFRTPTNRMPRFAGGTCNEAGLARGRGLASLSHAKAGLLNRRIAAQEIHPMRSDS